MAEVTPPLIDYYALLNLPPKADLGGVENAYARISDELVKRSEIDDTCHDALAKVNEAYSVLSKPELRRAYDREFFRNEIIEAERQLLAEARRRELMSRILVGVLALIVAVQAAALVYIGHGEATSLFREIAGVFA